MAFQRQAFWIGAGGAQVLCCLMLLAAVPCHVVGNTEVDALQALRQALIDPDQVLQSWDPNATDPCPYFHVTCGVEHRVIRIDLGNANLSGSLVPELGELSYLQYLEMFSNNLTGLIPETLGNLSLLVSLDLYENDLTGSIPPSLGDLSHLAYLRLQLNDLSGSIPESLTGLDTLKLLNLSYNDLMGDIPVTGVFANLPPTSFEGNPDLHYPTSIAPATAPSAPPPCQ